MSTVIAILWRELLVELSQQCPAMEELVIAVQKKNNIYQLIGQIGIALLDVMYSICVPMCRARTSFLPRPGFDCMMPMTLRTEQSAYGPITKSGLARKKK
jgi:hypothetical protein